MLLFARRWREESRSLLVWGIALGLTAFFTMLLAKAFGNFEGIRRSLEEWMTTAPPMIRSMIGGEPGLTDPAFLILSTLFSTIAPVLVMIYTTLTVLGFYTREASQGNLEFVFSLPIERLHLAAGRLLVFLANLALIHLVFFLAASMGNLAVNGSISATGLALASFNEFLLFASLGGLAFLISLALNDYTRGTLVLLGFQLALFILNLAMSDTSGFLRALNPNHYYDTQTILSAAVAPWRDWLVLAGSALVFWGIGFRIYIRKQI
jgi:ABC-2 type transport system permease protein